ncbi:membrane protein [Ureibacillus massiliensis 4400831 = CIP 108448 = CCUG 49529]|uniref:Membrane protein n=1 Tax=Ureibacillus massiliensis 4400831 = CIP 108448 = CCUG 49529 TaxID=1211035 RepID=A0A0A3J4Y6_9BACL|nr:hypothetical protein [Ureibacillus massiliensis]KGR90223.1 membrane protein [Ureibacillus massiliensis 4400831 = CIP 108448 = CCUG 49529]
MFLAFILLAAFCLFIGFKTKRMFYLTVPVIAFIVYFIVQIAMVPLPFMDTVKFIFSLQ